MNWRALRLRFLAAVVFTSGSTAAIAQETNANEHLIDLPAALRLAGAQNLDVQIAQERVNEAQAGRQSAVQQFFPWISAGVGYHRRDGVAQAVPSGIISDAHFQSYSPGVTLAAQIPLGDAIYNSLASKQVVKASDFAFESQRQNAVFAAAQGYFELAKARALVDVLKKAIEISEEYQQQLHAGVSSGISFRGDELRVQTQTEQYRISLEQALANERIAGVDLARLLHLDSRVALVPQSSGVEAIKLFDTNSAMDPLVERALRSRPELKESQASIEAAEQIRKGAVYGAWVPSIGAQVFGGGLGGGPDGGPSNFAAEGDYSVGLSWRIGPGGLLDYGRVNTSKARLAVAQLGQAKLKDIIIADVVSSLTRVNSAATQVRLAEKNLGTADETFRLTRQRKELGVGIVLEDIQAQQAVTQARSAYVTALAEHNMAQYALGRAVGGQSEKP